MDKLTTTARRALAQVGLQTSSPSSSVSGARANHRSADEAGQGDDSERLLSSPSPSGDSDLTIAGGEREGEEEKGRRGQQRGKEDEEEQEDEVACDCVCHHHHKTSRWPLRGRGRRRPPPLRETWWQRLTPSRINLFASVFWVLGGVVILLSLGSGRGDKSTPAHGNFGWCA